MPNYSRNEIVLVRFPFSDLTNAKVRPAVVINSAHSSHDLFLVALTTKTANLLGGEFILSEWKSAGLNVETALKRGIFTIHGRLILKSIGSLAAVDADELDRSLRFWINL